MITLDDLERLKQHTDAEVRELAVVTEKLAVIVGALNEFLETLKELGLYTSGAAK
jgi:hypothetical protein